MELKEKFNARKKIFKEQTFLLNANFHFFEPLETFNVKRLEKKIGMALPKDIIEFYKTCNGFLFDWSIKLDKNRITGYSFLMSYFHLFSREHAPRTGESKGFYNINTSNAKAKKLERLFIFDHIHFSNYVLCDFENSRDETQLYLYLHDGRLFKMNLNVMEYADKVLEYGAIYLWQRHFCNDYVISPLDLKDDCESNLKTIFKSVDTTSFNPELKRLTVPNTVVNYRKIFEDSISLFTKDKKVKITKNEIQLGAPIGYLTKAQYVLGKKLPDSLLAFYSQMNGIQLEWHKNNHGGAINMYSIENVLGGPISNFGHNNKDWLRKNDYLDILWFDEEDDEAEHYQKLRPLDVPYGTHDFVGINPDDFSLHFCSARSNIKPFPLSFEKYIQYLIDYLGTGSWHHLLIEGKGVKVGDFKLVDFIKENFKSWKL